VADLRDIRTLEVVLTASCNLRCGYCYQNAKNSRRMEWPVLQASLDLLLASRQPAVRILFIGGEPLLEIAAIRRAVEYVEQRRRPDLHVQFDLITNGLLLEPELASYLFENDFHVQLSFDGLPGAQSVRGVQTFPKLDALLDRLRHAERLYFESNVSVSMTLTPGTVPYFAESVRYFFKKGVTEIAVAPAIGIDDAWRLDDIAELDRQFARVYRLARRH
jgi:uncharacterized protein